MKMTRESMFVSGGEEKEDSEVKDTSRIERSTSYIDTGGEYAHFTKYGPDKKGKILESYKYSYILNEVHYLETTTSSFKSKSQKDFATELGLESNVFSIIFGNSVQDDIIERLGQHLEQMTIIFKNVHLELENLFLFCKKCKEQYVKLIEPNKLYKSDSSVRLSEKGKYTKSRTDQGKDHEQEFTYILDPSFSGDINGINSSLSHTTWNNFSGINNSLSSEKEKAAEGDYDSLPKNRVDIDTKRNKQSIQKYIDSLKLLNELFQHSMGCALRHSDDGAEEAKYKRSTDICESDEMKNVELPPPEHGNEINYREKSDNLFIESTRTESYGRNTGFPSEHIHVHIDIKDPFSRRTYQEGEGHKLFSSSEWAHISVEVEDKVLKAVRNLQNFTHVDIEQHYISNDIPLVDGTVRGPVGDRHQGTTSSHSEVSPLDSPMLPVPVMVHTPADSFEEVSYDDELMANSNSDGATGEFRSSSEHPKPTQSQCLQRKSGQFGIPETQSPKLLSGSQPAEHRTLCIGSTVLVVQTFPSGFDRNRHVELSRRGTEMCATNGAHRPVCNASQSTEMEEPHVASSLPPWAAQTPCIDISQAASPHLINLMDRCATYFGWPASSGQEPSDMALAGFAYSGEDKRVYCFYCGLILDYWSPSDDPWELHAQYRSSCKYLLQMMGQEKVTQILMRKSKK